MTGVSAYGKAKTRRRILDAAWALVEERGAEVTMAAVAERAGVSRQAVYLHVGDRTGLLIALINHLNDVLGLRPLLASVRNAPDAVTALRRMVKAHAVFTPKIIGVWRILDYQRHRDDAIARGWDDRMAARLEDHRTIVQRLADESRLADGWDVETAALLFYTLTLPRTWDELVVEHGWSAEQYTTHMTRLLERALIRDPPRRPPAAP